VAGTFLDRVAVRRGGIMNGSAYNQFPQSLAYTSQGLVTSFDPPPARRSSPYSDSSTLHLLNGETGDVSDAVAYVVTDHRYKLTSGSETLPLFMLPRRHAWGRDGRIFMTHQDG